MANNYSLTPSVSIIIASYNGASTLPETLDALARLNHPPGGIEFVLVDNRSSDSTAGLMKQFLLEQPGQYVFENAPGKSAALNAGIRIARGQLLLFTDDDVIPDCQWVSCFWDASKRLPEYDVFAGPVRLRWPGAATSWQIEVEKRGRTLGATPRDKRCGPVTFSEVKGANYAIRRLIIDEGSTFDTSLGVSSSGPMLAGEETAFLKELQLKGLGIYFVADAALEHIVRPHQTTIQSMIRRGFRNGRGSAQMEMAKLPPSRFHVFGLPGYVVRRVIGISADAFVMFLLGDKANAVSELIGAAEMAGFAYQAQASQAISTNDRAD